MSDDKAEVTARLEIAISDAVHELMTDHEYSGEDVETVVVAAIENAEEDLEDE